LLESAAAYAAQQGYTRLQQDAYAVHSHQRAVAQRAALAPEIVVVNGLQHDAYPRALTPQRAARMPVAVQHPGATACAVSSLAISTKADGAALVLLATPQACRDLGLQPQAAWLASCSLGADPLTPMRAAHGAATLALQRAGLAHLREVQVVELHDAFAVQGLDFCHELGLEPERINRRGGGLARGHPIGASGAIALVRVLADLQGDEVTGARGLAAVAGAGGLGAAALVQRL
jgi:acetyl-CoA C-acetyltransferase